MDSSYQPECKHGKSETVSGTQNIKKNRNVIRHSGKITMQQRIKRHGHKPLCYWFTGLSGSGKSSLACSFEERLFKAGRQISVLDGDNLRHGLNSDLGFSSKDREENIRRAGYTARLLYDTGFIILCCFISPKRSLRQYVRELFPKGEFIEVYVNCSLDECIRRDPKGLYAKAIAGDIPNFTGYSSPYQEPEHAEIVLNTENRTIDDCVNQLLMHSEALLGKTHRQG